MNGVLTVRYFAGARAAAGRPEETLPAEALPADCTLAQLTAALADRHGPRLAAVLDCASFLVDGTAWHDHEAVLPTGVTVDVLPPFAGG